MPLSVSLKNKEKDCVIGQQKLSTQWQYDWINNLYGYAYQFNISVARLLSSSIVNVFMFQYVEMNDEELDSKAGLIALEAARISQFYSLLTSSIDVIFKFCDKIPGFNDLCKQDRELLFRSACLELFTLRLSHRFYYIFSLLLCNLEFLSSRTLPNSMKLTFCNGTVLHRNQVRSTFGDWLNGITELSKSLQAIDIDASAYACLSALTLVNGK